jgi:hypothetical protein
LEITLIWSSADELEIAPVATGFGLADGFDGEYVHANGAVHWARRGKAPRAIMLGIASTSRNSER